MRPTPRPMILYVGLSLLLLGMLAACGNSNDDADAVEPLPDASATPSDSVGPSPSATPTPEDVPEVDIEEVVREAGCERTPAEVVSEPWLTNVSPNWLKFDHLTVAPAETGDGNWYSGKLTVAWWVESWEALDRDAQLTGRNLDSGIELQPVGIEHSYQVSNGVMARAWPDIPEEGCWEFAVAGQQFVAYVLPGEQRPSLIELKAEREAIKPYDPPPDCNATPWIGPISTPGVNDGFWLDAGPLEVWSRHGLVFVEGTHISIATEDPGTQVTGVSESNPALRLYTEMQPPHGMFLTMVGATLSVPVPGCWTLTIEADGQSMDATVYVYPQECWREPGDDLPADCIVPE